MIPHSMLTTIHEYADIVTNFVSQDYRITNRPIEHTTLIVYQYGLMGFKNFSTMCSYEIYLILNEQKATTV